MDVDYINKEIRVLSLQYDGSP